ncbi:aldolase/citrate lyase family protein [Roseibium sp.]|uniref:aldolase/citrate lyase family protein n=1 Tax=Roseibium sp. TaxID=1936156 RepID=UPI003D0CD8C5
MPAPQNQFKAALKADKSLIGCWVGLADPYVAEITGSAGFDWLLIDCEHAPNDLRSMMTQLKVLEASDSFPAVRLPIGETWMIKQFLDAGAQTLLIPMVESKAQAEELVRAVRYPPNGVRGVGAALARASHFAGIPDYLTTANQEICLLVQVETREALSQIKEIAQVPGVDGVFFGPADLAASFGYPGQPSHPEVKKAILDGIGLLQDLGVPAGILSLDQDFLREAKVAGASFIAVDVDSGLLRRSAVARRSEWS